ncbi:MAG: tRNA uridine-5-carboxymethylaminomethyl(34) synthesis GTPase MnmE [Burkholderiaceae bacterium]|nr:MAG: tRNA uridine-5-carboxymethylaminomethyl(34) synthesis GTPase MnmE [Burkholderiaceae bacterium]TAM10880.1 MAG: tRNA uridine-5-carboxymethylaminomethyl(34) synthesis GTPase MnmE [Pusillimonas sp.]
MTSFSHQPIVAIATAPGRSGIGVIRISGADLTGLMQQLFAAPLKPRHAHYLPFNDANGIAIDAGIAIYFKAPQSYTGEDVLELQGHGGPMVLRRLLKRCLDAGQDFELRLAEPGEFTRRAFLNERMDLAQAEAVADLIDASSEAAARSAMASLSGEFSNRVNTLADHIVHLRMLVEATLNFPEEEIDFLEKYQAQATLSQLRSDLSNLVRQAGQGLILREGLQVVLAGQPNVGKSSLLNALVGEDAAIVTPMAGTTRDKVTRQIHIQGVPIHIIDTAGLRDTDDTIESIGIARSWEEIEKADVIIHLQDVRAHDDTLDSAITQRLPAHTPILKVLNKIDLLADAASSTAPEPDSKAAADAAGKINAVETFPPVADGPTERSKSDDARTEYTLAISAKTGAGLDDLRERLLDIAGWSPSSESPWLARERHLQALNHTTQHLDLAAEHASHGDLVLDLFAEELRLAHNELCAITGQFTSDDLLGEIFSSFCIGK